MVVAAKSRAQTNHRMLDLSGAEVVMPGAAMLAVLLDMGEAPAGTSVGSRPPSEIKFCDAGVAGGGTAGCRFRCAASVSAPSTPSAWYSRRSEKTIADILRVVARCGVDESPVSADKRTLRIPRGRRMRVLIVEDDSALGHFLCQGLRLDGHEVA